MRVVPVLLSLAALSASAQIGRQESTGGGPPLNWTLGFQKVQPSFSTSLTGSRDGKASLVDMKKDLGMGRDGSPLGFLLEYQGQIQAFQISYDSARYRGDGALPRDILMDGTPYAAGTHFQSTAKVEVWEGLWTYKFVRRPDAWIGFDLGLQRLRANLATLAPEAATAQTARPAWTVPQVGITGWSAGANGLLESRVYLRYFTHRGATLTRYGMDVRAYLYPSFGLRAFWEENRMAIRPGSLQQDLDIRAERRITGLGLVLRF